MGPTSSQQPANRSLTKKSWKLHYKFKNTKVIVCNSLERNWRNPEKAGSRNHPRKSGVTRFCRTWRWAGPHNRTSSSSKTTAFHQDLETKIQLRLKWWGKRGYQQMAWAKAFAKSLHSEPDAVPGNSRGPCRTSVHRTKGAVCSNELPDLAGS